MKERKDMSKPKRQHIVPASYLRNFSFKKNIKDTSSFVYTLIKGHDEISELSVKDVAVEKNFYTLDNLKDKYYWEKYYSGFPEQTLSSVCKRLIQYGNSYNVLMKPPLLLDLDIADLSKALTYQMLRDNSSRSFMNAVIENNIDLIVRGIKQKCINKNGIILTADAIEKSIKNNLKLAFAESSLSPKLIARIARILSNRYWFLIKIQDEREFITSDKPVLFLNNFRGVSFLDDNFDGLQNPHIQVWFPISPKIAVYSIHKDIICLKYFDRKIMFADDANLGIYIDMINKAQHEQSFRQSFSRCREELEMAIKR